MEGNTAWVLASAALVLFMTPGLAFFYGGMVRSKNVLGMLMQNFFCMGLVSVLWAVVVFSLAFGGTGRFIGDFGFVGLKTLGNIKTVIPSYQGDFALVVPALAFCGAVAGLVAITPCAGFVDGIAGSLMVGRCTDDEEVAGLDLSQHVETAYAFGELGSMGRTG